MDLLQIEDLLTVRKVLLAYIGDLSLSSMHVEEIALWREKVSKVEKKIADLILKRPHA